MSIDNELNNIPTPQLTLEAPTSEEAVDLANQVEEVALEASLIATEVQVPALGDSLSPDEMAQAEAFSKQIDLTDSHIQLTYGSGAQKKMADFSESALEKVRTRDLGETGELITNVILELKNFDADDQKGLFGFFKRQVNKVTALKARYDKAEANVDKIVESLENHQLTLMKDSAMLDKLYELNLSYYKELTMYLVAGRKRLEEVRTEELQELIVKAKESNQTEDAEAVRKLEDSCNRFEKKLLDLDLTRTVSMQMAPQIRLVQANEMLMIEKIQTTLVNTIPLWKSQMVLALGMANNEAALRAQTAVTEATNQMLKENAKKLKQSTVQVARESERAIVDIETLRATNQNLIQTFDEVMKIQEDSRAKRAETERELRKLEAELKQKLLAVQE